MVWHSLVWHSLVGIAWFGLVETWFGLEFSAFVQCVTMNILSLKQKGLFLFTISKTSCFFLWYFSESCNLFFSSGKPAAKKKTLHNFNYKIKSSKTYSVLSCISLTTGNVKCKKSQKNVAHVFTLPGFPPLQSPCQIWILRNPSWLLADVLFTVLLLPVWQAGLSYSAAVIRSINFKN